MESSLLYEIAIKTPLRKLFTYESDQELLPGSRVRVPFRSQTKVGFVWKASQDRPKGLKKVSELLDEKPLFDEASLKFYEQAANYYGISVGEILNASVPKKIREGLPISSVSPKHFVPRLPVLSEAQEKVFRSIDAMKSQFVSPLILGETGSGKTEIYLHLMESILMEGGQILFLVPEISLTPQLEDRLADRLGSPVTVFHSNVKESKRYEAFARAWQGETDIFLGARSALFLPFRKLQLIVIDEEHDHSYKQSERGPYHARDLALLKAKNLNIPVVLGSATPSLETYYRVQEQSQELFYLPKFYKTPKIKLEIIDLKETWKTEEKSFITKKLFEGVSKTLEKGEQALLFLNRRGSATQRICVECGSMEECRFCSSRLTLHFDLNRAICHLCGFQKEIEAKCAECGSSEFFVGGVGTKEIESQMKQSFPEARVARLDRDQTQKKNVLPETLRDFADAKIDILVGTQMVSKGLDIPNLSLVGVVLADQGWGVPDFRATEKSFQLLHQLIGRAGRRGQESQCIIQTFSPKHPIFQSIQADKAFQVFAKSELELRKQTALPPFSRFLLWTLSDKEPSKLEQEAAQFVKRIEKLAKMLHVEIYGPVQAPLFRWKGRYRYQVMAKAKGHLPLSNFMLTVLDDVEKRPLGVKLRTDRDPYQFL